MGKPKNKKLSARVSSSSLSLSISLHPPCLFCCRSVWHGSTHSFDIIKIVYLFYSRFTSNLRMHAGRWDIHLVKLTHTHTHTIEHVYKNEWRLYSIALKCNGRQSESGKTHEMTSASCISLFFWLFRQIAITQRTECRIRARRINVDVCVRLASAIFLTRKTKNDDKWKQRKFR